MMISLIVKSPGAAWASIWMNKTLAIGSSRSSRHRSVRAMFFVAMRGARGRTAGMTGEVPALDSPRNENRFVPDSNRPRNRVRGFTSDLRIFNWTGWSLCASDDLVCKESCAVKRVTLIFRYHGSGLPRQWSKLRFGLSILAGSRLRSRDRDDGAVTPWQAVLLNL